MLLQSLQVFNKYFYLQIFEAYLQYIGISFSVFHFFSSLIKFSICFISFNFSIRTYHVFYISDIIFMFIQKSYLAFKLFAFQYLFHPAYMKYKFLTTGHCKLCANFCKLKGFRRVGSPLTINFLIILFAKNTRLLHTFVLRAHFSCFCKKAFNASFF